MANNQGDRRIRMLVEVAVVRVTETWNGNEWEEDDTDFAAEEVVAEATVATGTDWRAAEEGTTWTATPEQERAEDTLRRIAGQLWADGQSATVDAGGAPGPQGEPVVLS